MEKILAAWKIGTIQDALNMEASLSAKGKNWNDVRAYLAAVKKDAGAGGKAPIAASRPCPVCGHGMRLYPVNIDPRGTDRIGTTAAERGQGTEYRSMWFCRTKGCWHEDYSVLPVRQEAKKYQAQTRKRGIR